jgi:tetratricopeptide (TPR) repeat protein
MCFAWNRRHCHEGISIGIGELANVRCAAMILTVRGAGMKRRVADRVQWIWIFVFWLFAVFLSPAQQASPPPLAIQSSELDQARSLVREGRTRDAEAAVHRYLRSGKDDEEAHGLLGLILYQEGKPAESLAEFTRAAKFAVPTPSELMVVGLDYVRLKDLPNADKWMTVAVERQPRNASALQYLGGIKYSENRFAEAIQIYGKFLEIHPRDVLVEDAVGRSFEGLARDDDAAAAFRTALDWQAHEAKQHYEPMLHLGALLLKSGRSQEALPLLARAEQIAPSDADVHQQLGTLWEQTGDLNKAQNELELALKISPANSHVHWLLASVYRRQGKTEQANRELKEYSALLGAHSTDKLQ